jgi:hypothetical protein
VTPNHLSKSVFEVSTVQVPIGFFGTTSVQLSERKNGFLTPKRHQIKHLEFVIAWFGTRGSEVQILSPRPLSFSSIHAGFVTILARHRLGLFSPPSGTDVVESVVGPRETRKKGGSGGQRAASCCYCFRSPVLDQAALLLGPQLRFLLGVVFSELSERALDLLGVR